MKRAALIAGVSVATLLCAGPGQVWAAWNTETWWAATPAVTAQPAPVRRSIKPRSKPADKAERNPRETEKPAPTGLLHIIVSIDKQRATLFADGVPFASTPISSGTASHPTPMGVFSIIQKNRHHVSNLYNAPMPYMQRITWSGSALHQGALPGYPASHGCVRLPESFAQLLWKTTKMGARVIVTRPEVTPLEFDHAKLFVPKPQMVEVLPLPLPRPSADAPAPTPLPRAAAEPVPAPAIAAEVAPSFTSSIAKVRTADAANTVPVAVAPVAPSAITSVVTSVLGDDTKAVATSVVTEPSANTPAPEQPTKLSVTDGAGNAAKLETAAADTTPPVETQAAEAKHAEDKRAEDKPVEASPVEVAAAPQTAPVEPTPAATQAAEVPSAEVKPAEAPAAEVSAVETKPVEAPPVEAKPPVTVAVEAKVETKSVEAKPVETKPVAPRLAETLPMLAAPAPIIVEERPKARSVEAKAIETKPAETVPAMAAPASVAADERPKAMPPAVVREANGRPISVFVSLKESKLYVRQGWKPLFDAPVSFERPDQPIGTHVFTAMGMKVSGQALRWTVVSLPSSSKRASDNKRVAELKSSNSGRKGRHDHVVVEVEPPMPSASAALDRLILPPELVEQISELITPGSSLIVSDNRLSDETGEYTDFIVLTR